MWDAVGGAGAAYDVYFTSDGSFPGDSVMGTANNSAFKPYSQLYNGLYTITIRVHCPDGTTSVASVPVVLLVNDKDCKIEVPICPGIKLGGSNPVMQGGIKEIAVPCDKNTYTLKPEIPVTGGVIDHYDVTAIPYRPPFPFVIPGGSSINLTNDDNFANIAALPFTFCFYENSYNQVLMGPNGNLSFNVSLAGQYCQWSLSNTPYPNPSAPDHFNSIFGVLEDVDPDPNHLNANVRHLFNATFQYAVLGKNGCRVFLMSYNEVPMFSCGTDGTKNNSYQIVLYEGTNIIDVYVKKRNTCGASGWNDGRGVIGVQNINGTKATIAPGRNSSNGAWSTITNGVNQPEAWRFTPVTLNAQYDLAWYNLGSTTPFSSADSLVFNCNDGARNVIAKYSFTSCNGSNFIYRDTVKVHWERKPYSLKKDSICQNEPYTWRGRTVPTQWGDRLVVIKDTAQSTGSFCCDSIFELQLYVGAPVFDQSFPKDTICFGEEYILGNKTLTESGYYLDTLLSSTGCINVISVNLKVLPAPNANAEPLPGEICADDPSFTVSHLPLTEANTVLPTGYIVDFDAEAEVAGFADFAGRFANDALDIEIPIPVNVPPGKYNCSIEFTEEVYQCKGESYDLTFDVFYPTSVLQQKFDDIIAVKNKYYNGGYDFTAYTWYKNGAMMTDAYAEKSYIYLGNEALDTTDKYYVVLTTSDGKIMRTCSFVPTEPKPSVSDFPTIVTEGNSVKIYLAKDNASARLWTTTGILLQTVKLRAPEHIVQLPQQIGTYLFEVAADNGQRQVLPVVVNGIR
jgi:hypothetical protein